MKIYATWILIFTIVQMTLGRDTFDHDFEIFHTDDHNSFRSQSLYPSPDIKSSDYYINNNNNNNDGNNYNDDDGGGEDYNDNSHNIHRRFTDYRIGQLPRITAEQEKISDLPLYISPDEVSHRLTRSPQSPGHRDYIHNYKEFLEKHFARSYDDDGAGVNGKNAKYQSEQAENVNDKDDYRDEVDHGDYKSSEQQQQGYGGGGGGGSGYNNKNDNKSGGHLRSNSGSGHNNDDDAEIYHYIPSTSSRQNTNAYNDEYERIKKLSQEQEKSIQKDPKNCKTEIRGDMKCSVCVDPKSGDNSESCSYSAEPTDKKYAYTRERNYDSKDDDDNNNNKDNDQKSSKKNSEYKPLKTNKSSQLKQEHQSTITATTSTTTSPTTETPKRYQRLRSRRPKATQSTLHSSPADVEITSLYNNNNQQKSAALKQQSRRSGSSLKPQNPQPYRDENKKFRSSYKAEESRPQRDVIGLDPFLYGGGGDVGSSSSSSNGDNTHHNYRVHNDNDNDYKTNRDIDDSTRSQRLRSYEDYFSHVFPESKYSAKQPIYDEPENVEILSSSYKSNNGNGNGGASANNGNDYDDGNDQTKNVASVLADFKKRDWSTCQKSKKGDLTCYNCKDDKGVKHEECMYESSSNPSKSRLAYTELKEYHENDNDDNKNKNRNNNDHSNYRRDSDNDSSDIIASIHDDEKITKNKSNGNKRAAIIRKRKVTSNNSDDKIVQPLKATTESSVSNDDDDVNSSPPKPEDILENQSGQKRTFKRTVSYRIEKNDETDPNKSKIMVFEHKYSQVA